MSRPTLGLAVIAKNEINNIDQWYKSVEGLFDEYHFVDTGSTDGTVERAKELGLTVHHFDWIDDFAAARNYAFSKVTSDYIFWNDLDDVIENKEAFIKWRDTSLEFADYWTANYNYSSDKDGKPLCSFIRERAVRASKKLKWKYFIHEGIMPVSDFGKVVGSHIGTWSIKHMRTEEDLKKDKSRNLNIFEKNKDKLDARMRFYYGKELYEANKLVEAASELMKAATEPTLEVHDRILAIQYAAYSYMSLNQWEQAMGIALNGIQLDSNRAEFYCMAGDCLVKQNKLIEAIPLFQAAKHCINRNNAQANQTGPIFTFADAYTTYPRNQLARIFANIGNVTSAEAEAKENIEKFKDATAENLLIELNKVKKVTAIGGDREKTTDIVISCPPTAFKEWDENALKEWGVGGSETAAIIMAKELSKQSGRKVLVFNNVKYPKSFGLVEYRPSTMVNEYFSKYEPAAHIAWRHNIKLTNAPTYLWCHDLLAHDVANTNNYVKLLALSEFHKNFINSMTGVPLEKIQVTRNGIFADRYDDTILTKVKGQVVFTSSADRGLDKAIRVMDHVVKEIPEAKLHVFYGFDNMKLIGKAKEAEYYEKMINDRPYVVYHGNTQQDKLTDFLKESEVWLYPTDFMETFCITALEMIGCKVFPVTRAFGALKNTLNFAKEKGFADLLEIPCETESQHQEYASHVINAIREESWKRINQDMSQFSWESVAKEWLEWLTTLPSKD